jgi:hypothetical protein
MSLRVVREIDVMRAYSAVVFEGSLAGRVSHLHDVRCDGLAVSDSLGMHPDGGVRGRSKGDERCGRITHFTVVARVGRHNQWQGG